MHVIYGVNATYVLPALVSIYSLRKHASQPVDVTIYVDGITKENQHAIQCVRESCDIAIQVKDFEATGLEEYVNTRFPAVSLLPLLLPSLEKGRCLFIDADTLIKSDVWELLSADLSGMPIGACTDIGILSVLERRILGTRVSDIFRPARARRRRMNYIKDIAGLGFVPKENYFNSGLLVMDCEAIRRQCPDYTDLASMDKLRPYTSMPDQNRLNEFFAGHWFRLSLKWNVSPGLKKDFEKNQYKYQDVSEDLRVQIQEAIQNPKLWHFMGSKKPWTKRWSNRLRVRKAYREYNQTCLEFRDKTSIMFGV